MAKGHRGFICWSNVPVIREALNGQREGEDIGLGLEVVLRRCHVGEHVDVGDVAVVQELSEFDRRVAASEKSLERLRKRVRHADWRELSKASGLGASGGLVW